LTGPYERDSGVHDETPCNTTITENFTAANTGTGPSVDVCEAMSWIAVYTAQLNSGTFLGQMLVEWPTSESTSSFDGGELSILELDRWDWDVMHHEYGHYVMESFNIDDNPGGSHSSANCLSDARSDKSEGIRLAWGEGWPTYFGTVGQEVLGLASLNVPRVGDVRYQDTEDINVNYSLESQGTPEGEDNEAAVQRLFWDLHDAASDGRDTVDADQQTLFNIVNAADPDHLSGAWAAIRATLSNTDQLAYGEVAADHGVGPTLVSPTQGTIVSPSSNNSFNWDRAVGCSSNFDGDSFSLRFFRADNAAPILSIPVGNTTSTSLSLAQFQTLVAATHNVYWAVEGSNTSSPTTGPYLGESFTITVNRPPVAEAGNDITAECTSPTTTPVQLNGTASSDPDGDTITWSWSASGVSFDNPNSSTPTGQFPMGTTVVTLTVSDGIESDTDQVSVTVDDTTPPVVGCPTDITIECNDHCQGGGVPSDDPQLVAFFRRVLGDGRLRYGSGAHRRSSACFPLGTTTVTFTACDHHTNCASCSADVRVVDTTPPEVAVELNRDVLWPPNHRLVTISAAVTVTDVCDPNPTFVLTSITSNEPDNGLGDGDTVNDIQGDDLGTADIEFLLRSERSGRGNGRLYTILYTASDQSGNTAQDTVYVRVPHDRSGEVISSAGFQPLGKALEPGRARFQLVVLAGPQLDATTIDAHNAYLGNTEGAIRPVQYRHGDLNGDRLQDLQLFYDVAATEKLRSISGESPVGMHYVAGGVDYLAPDIFDLGEPMVFAELPASDESPPAVAANDAAGAENPKDAAPAGSSGSKEPERAESSSGSSFRLATAGMVHIDVFDVTGRKVRSLVNAPMDAGEHRLVWDGRDHAGRRAASGMYFYRIEGPGLSTVKRVRIIR
jgi:hypothetical protein